LNIGIKKKGKAEVRSMKKITGVSCLSNDDDDNGDGKGFLYV